MEIEIIPSPDFVKAYKRLKKRYRSLKSDLDVFENELRKSKQNSLLLACSLTDTPKLKMKKYLLSVLALLFIVPSFAQELKELHLVGKPKKLNSGEMVARQDQNGNYCAAIQVISDMDGFSYDSWDGIVGNVENKPGKDMVFLTASERVLEIFKTGYKPLKVILSDHGVTLKPREVWQIEVAGDETASMLPVTFRFTPDDAKLFIDGNNAGSKLTQNLSVGQHQIRIERDGYQAKEETITVNDEKVFFEWELDDAPDAGLQITTEPEGATIYLDGVKLGESPVAVFYPPGTYPIKISLDGYVSIEGETLEVTLPKTSKNYILEENVGYLTVNTREGATVYFNDEVVSNPVKVKLAPQLVKVKVSMPKAEDLEEQVVLKKDDDKVLNIYPDIQIGTIQVALTPFDAEIELTGDAGEHYTATGMKIFNDVPVGTYTLKVFADDHKTIEETIVLKPFDKLNKTITLEKGSDIEAIEMVFVKGGTFTMGCTSEQSDCSDYEKPTHQVTVSDFYMGKYEVTQKQWHKVMSNNPSKFKNCDNCPVEQVSWNDVQKFIKKLNQKTGKNYRLPTEAEWEYAASGGAERSRSARYKYAGSNNIDEVAWYSSNSGSKTHPVGQKKPNELGLYDMSGNVYEWCSDWYGGYSSGSQTNPKGPLSGSNRVLRGGSWNSNARSCLVANRNFNNNPDSRNNNNGFRLVLAP